MHDADALPPGPSPTRLAIADAFAKVAASAPEGYRTLARLREAALRADAGDLNAALALWAQVADDSSANQMLRDLATLLWGAAPDRPRRPGGHPRAPEADRGRRQPLAAPGPGRRKRFWPCGRATKPPHCAFSAP
ncbi:MAG: hypothetical protein WDN49_27910 [Acetobacteraceae bacterium]